MEIATLINAHTNPEMLRDTIDAVRLWVTRKILVVIDQANWSEFENFQHPDVIITCGYYHKCRKSPYKNFALGMNKLYETWPDVDWYNYIEFDVLYLNSEFKVDLEALQNEDNVALAGFQHYKKRNSKDHWLTEEILGGDVECHKMLGAVQFWSNGCMSRLCNLDFFNQVIERTSHLTGHDFPDFHDYAVEEIIFPSAASKFGEIRNIHSTISSQNRYLVRFTPEIKPDEVLPSNSILHPIKFYDNPIHKHYRNSRKLFLETLC